MKTETNSNVNVIADLKIFEFKASKKQTIFKVCTQESDLIADTYNSDHAALIVSAVNNHAALIGALKDVVDNSYTFANGMKHVPDAFINSAKKLLQQIESEKQ